MGSTTFRDFEFGLFLRFARNASIIAVAALVLYGVWSCAQAQTQAVNTVLAEARAFNVQIKATWDYIDAIQDTINRDSDGTYNFKGVYCATAAKTIAESFTDLAAGYTLRYVRDNPRNLDDRPDAFEAEALLTFRSSVETEYYAVADYNGQDAFRYVSKLTIDEGCLDCHGSPAGTRDKTGGWKEGLKLGGLAGACSIVIPIDSYIFDALSKTALTIAFFALLMVGTTLTLTHILRRHVMRPIEQAGAHLEQDAAAKGDFLTLVGHELRTPLSSIIAFTDLWENSGGHNEERDRQMVQEVRESSEELLRMVNNVIDMSKVDAGRYEIRLEEVDVLDVVRTVKSALGPLALKKGISLDAQLDPKTPIITSDWELIRKILVNLVGNALKFTETGGAVDIVVRAQEDRDTILIEVRDTGCGISEKDCERIFERFEQGHTSSRAKEKGSGLGLSLSREFASMLGGQLGVTSYPGIGSTFFLTLPKTTPGSALPEGEDD